MLNQITPVILTYNEAPNIGRTLDALSWAKRIVVLDSLSDDSTQRICQGYANVDFQTRPFDTHAQQWNAAINLQIETKWILALDADYCLSHELINELRTLNPDNDVGGFEASFVYKIDGKPLRGSLYPPVVTLFKHGQGQYEQDGHTQRVKIKGQVLKLTHCIYHDDRKSSTRWHSSQKKYAEQEARKLRKTSFRTLSVNDKARRLYLGPLLVVPYTLLVRGLIFDGRKGFKYTWQRLIAEAYLLKAWFGQSR